MTPLIISLLIAIGLPFNTVEKADKPKQETELTTQGGTLLWLNDDK